MLFEIKIDIIEIENFVGNSFGAISKIFLLNERSEENFELEVLHFQDITFDVIFCQLKISVNIHDVLISRSN